MDFFNDSKVFVDSAKVRMKKPAVLGEEALTNQDVFRLRKIVQKTRNNMNQKKNTHTHREHWDLPVVALRFLLRVTQKQEVRTDVAHTLAPG